MGLGDFLGKQPVKANFSGVVRQVQQLFSFLQLAAEGAVNLLIQLHVQGLVQHVRQLVEADLPPESGKVQVVPQNGKLQSRQHRVIRSGNPGADVLHPLQHEPVGLRLFLAEPVQGQTVVLVEKLRYLGIEPGGADVCRGLQIHPH